MNTAVKKRLEAQAQARIEGHPEYLRKHLLPEQPQSWEIQQETEALLDELQDTLADAKPIVREIRNLVFTHKDYLPEKAVKLARRLDLLLGDSTACIQGKRVVKSSGRGKRNKK